MFDTCRGNIWNLQKIFTPAGLPGDVADEEDGDDDHKDDGEVRLPPPGLARADVGVPAAQLQMKVHKYFTITEKVPYSHYLEPNTLPNAIEYFVIEECEGYERQNTGDQEATPVYVKPE